MHLFKIIFIFLFILIFFNSSFATTLDEIKERDFLICGVSEPTTGFADFDDESNWKGFDVDMCRAISSAIFADPNKVEFKSTTNRSRFPLLSSGEIDVLSRITTWTFSRDVNLGFEYAGINFYDGLGFMIDSSLLITSANELDGVSICTINGSAFEFYIDQYFNNKNISYEKIPVELDDEAFENFLSGRCDIYTNYITSLAEKRLSLPNSSKFEILPELISKEPLGVLVRHGDDQWKDVVSWTLKVMILAEELNINSKNIDSFLLSEDNEILRLLGEIGSYGDMIELDEKWAYNIIKQIGNYEEVFDRNLGKNSSLNLKRGLNKLYNEGGLLYAPPFR